MEVIESYHHQILIRNRILRLTHSSGSPSHDQTEQRCSHLPSFLQGFIAEHLKPPSDYLRVLLGNLPARFQGVDKISA